MGRFLCEIKGSGSGIAAIKFSGVLESEGLLTTVHVDSMDSVIIDLSAFKGMNSSGAREFIKWGSRLRNPAISFVHCPKFFIDFVNSVPGFMPANSKIDSFYVPYYSEESSEEEMILFERGFSYGFETGKLEIFWPEVKDTRGVLMSPDVVEAKFFRFLTKYG
jgi:hypothetical protein